MQMTSSSHDLTPGGSPLSTPRRATSAEPLPLIVTNRGDHTADFLIREFEKRKAPFLRFNTEDLGNAARLTWRSSGQHCLRIDEESYELSQFRSVWYRRPVTPRIVDGDDPNLHAWASQEAREALQGLWSSHSAVWVNHPTANYAAGFKQEQLIRAASIGFRVPDTLVTNCLDDAMGFIDSHSGDVVCKPLRMGRLSIDGEEKLFFTSVITAEDLEQVADGGEPYLFQALVPKQYDIRVTVIGGTCFAARIESQLDATSQVDWRRRGSDLAHKMEKLPEEIERRCVALVAGYGLQFGAIDLARASDGEYSFFEINPNGQWAWIEQLTGLPLRSALADLLLAPC